MKKQSENKKFKQTQIFTPKWVTESMLDLLDQKYFQDDRTYYFEPSCGEGQMLVVVIDRIYKALLEKYKGTEFRYEKALADTCTKFYGIEIDETLIPKARIRIYNYLTNRFLDYESFNYKAFSTCLIARVLVDKIEHKDFFKLFNQSKPGKRLKG